jgi:hypothetical protein
VLANLSFSVREALLLFVLFATQLAIPDPRFRYYYAFGYIFLAVGFVLLRRDSRLAVGALFEKAPKPHPIKEK